MRRLLNTLYVTQPDAYLSCDGENVLVRIDNETRFRMPIHNLEGIVCFGFAGASPGLMYLCCERGVTLSFLTSYGKFMGRVTGSVSGNVLLRRTQYPWADNPEICLNISRRFILAKIMNSRAVLHRAMRDHSNRMPLDKFDRAIHHLLSSAKNLEQASDTDMIRGIEGEAAGYYFSCFDHMILSNKEFFHFTERNRRPPLDRVNALLSFLYTLLSHEVEAALESVGLDPQVGFLHKDRSGRASLALDMMEELRAYFVDRLTLTLINRQQITPNGFIEKRKSCSYYG